MHEEISPMSDDAEPIEHNQAAPPEPLEPLSDLPEGEAAQEGARPTLSHLESLSMLIEEYPEEPSNYVLRGEMLLDGGLVEQAADDFRKALDLAEMQAKTSNWGYIHEAVADRARIGLRDAHFPANSTI